MAIRSTLVFSVANATLLVASAASAATIQFRQDSLPDANYDMIATDMRTGTSSNNVRENDNALLVGRVTGTVTGGIATDVARTLLAFDITSVPAGATITGVTLTLTKRAADTSTSGNEDHTITVHELMGTILESTTNGPSWNNRDQDTVGMNPIPWTTPGGDFNPTVLTSLTANARTTGPGVKFVFPSTAEFVTAASNARSGSGTIYMLLQSADSVADNDRGLFQFFTDDSALYPTQFGIDDHPLLTVDYVPEPTSFALLGLGAIGLLVYRRRPKR
jgi:hypothetical protein